MTTMAADGLVLQVSTSSEDFLELPEKDDDSLGGRVIVVHKASMANGLESAQDKAQDLRDCLYGHSADGTVDLWELRQLALTPGGLLSPAWRRVAWPLLTGVSLSSLEEAAAAATKHSGLDEPIIARQIQQDVARTVWNLEDLVRQQSTTGKESFWYAPLLQQAGSPTSSSSNDNEGSHNSAAAPGMVLSSPCSSSDTSHETEPTTTTPSSPIPQDNNTNPKDLILLTKVLTQALQGQPPAEYPQGGLANLAALLLLNLESTCLSSLLLKQLHPLQAAFGGAITTSLPSLLQCLVDQFISTSTQVDDTRRTAERAMAWGAQGGNLQAASRLLDAFLVSHPLFPLYLGVAAVDRPASWTVETVEELISKALDYMEELPPRQLWKQASSIASPLPSPPTWALAAHASADWAAIHGAIIVGQQPTFNDNNYCQQARSEPFSDEDSSTEWERLSTASHCDTVPDVDDNDDGNLILPTKETLFHDSYPLAMTAAGLGLASTKKKKSRSPSGLSAAPNRRYWHMVFLVTAIVAVLVAAFSQPSSVPSSIQAPRQKILGVVPVERPAPKKVLHLQHTSMAQLVKPVTTKEKKPSMAEPMKTTKKEKPAPPAPKEKFLGVISVDRPAPKKVLMSMGVKPVTRKEKKPSMAEPMKTTKNEKPKEKFLGVISVDRPAPKKVLMSMVSPAKSVQAPRTVPPTVVVEEPPKAAPAPRPVAMEKPPLVPASPQAKLTFMVPEAKQASTKTSPPPEAEQRLQNDIKEGMQSVGLGEYCESSFLEGWVAPTAEQKPVQKKKKFQPLRPIKKQWKKVVTFVRRRFGRKKGQTS